MPEQDFDPFGRGGGDRSGRRRRTDISPDSRPDAAYEPLFPDDETAVPAEGLAERPGEMELRASHPKMFEGPASVSSKHAHAMSVVEADQAIVGRQDFGVILSRGDPAEDGKYSVGQKQRPLAGPQPQFQLFF